MSTPICPPCPDDITPSDVRFHTMLAGTQDAIPYLRKP